MGDHMKKMIIIILIFSLSIASCTVNQEDKLDLDNMPNTNNSGENHQENKSLNMTDVQKENITDNQDEQERIKEYPIQLKLEKLDDSVKLTWTKYQGDYTFSSYKVSRSVSDSNPQYPGHTLRETIPDINKTEYIDNLPEPGISYYVVTALGPFNEKTFSNPVMVEFPNPKETPDQDIKLDAEYTDNGVELRWDEYNGDFLFYKVEWTTKHPYPKYPDDTTIATIAYVNQTEYTHINPDPGLNYYAVTIIRPDRSRFTSERASVEIK